MTRLAFVVPRYGQEVLGGAETITRHLVERLPYPEFEVEVLTTCASDMTDWRNVYPPGRTQVNGVTVWRFPIDHHLRDAHRYQELTLKFINRWPLTVDEEYEWIEHSPHSPALYTYIARYADTYDLLICGPYLFGITIYSAALRPERTVIWPHLHDEPFARFLETRLMMESCRGVMFNSEPERHLAVDRLGVRNPRTYVVGEGVDEHPSAPDRFRRRFGLMAPFILYVGRLEGMKNLIELFAFFSEYKRTRPGPLKLVLIGKGPLTIPAHPDIIALGFVDEQAKRDAYAAAVALCQPSRLESFSLVIMEAWLAGTPVLVHGDCDVTRYHVLHSNGGLFYADYEEFVGALDWLLEHPTERACMGQLGRNYVQREYSWETVLERFRAALKLWQ